MKFKHIIENYNLHSVSNETLANAICALYPALDVVERTNPKMFWAAMCEFHEQLRGKHFDEMYAKYQVAQMYHIKKNGIVCKGEVYSEDYAREIYERKVRSINSGYNCWDVYVAINAQYHDYSKLYKEWNSSISDEELNEKIICSAINFWFKDDDAEDGKVWNYFKSMN